MSSQGLGLTWTITSCGGTAKLGDRARPVITINRSVLSPLSNTVARAVRSHACRLNRQGDFVGVDALPRVASDPRGRGAPSIRPPLRHQRTLRTKDLCRSPSSTALYAQRSRVTTPSLLRPLWASVTVHSLHDSDSLGDSRHGREPAAIVRRGDHGAELAAVVRLRRFRVMPNPWESPGASDTAPQPSSDCHRTHHSDAMSALSPNPSDAPSWSPDGKFVYVASDRGGVMGLWRVPVDEASGTPQEESNIWIVRRAAAGGRSGSLPPLAVATASSASPAPANPRVALTRYWPARTRGWPRPCPPSRCPSPCRR